MGAAGNAIAAGEIVSLCAMSADEAVKRLATSREKGLDAAEGSTRLHKCGPNHLPEGKKRGPFMRVPRPVQQHPCRCSSGRRAPN
ncbi:MAG: cation-transporting P-type ATPase, partial [Rhodomicrobium sp.]